MPLYDRLGPLRVEIDSVELETLRLQVRPEFVRATTVVHLRGGAEEGVGEDPTYDSALHEDVPVPPLEGFRGTLEELSARLDGVDLFAAAPSQHAYLDYRRWAWESAALDLALRQAGRSLGDAIGREPRPVMFVASGGLGEPPSTERLRKWLGFSPGLRFKLDPTPPWDEALVAELAELDVVDTVDLKGAYRGTVVDNPPSERLYRLVADGFPRAWIEDPNLDDDPAAAAALEPHRDRITWDAPIHSVADVDALPFPPRTLNVKPSRFGTLQRLFDFYETCEQRGIALYGGGQFELGPGRGHIQHLASLLHADTPNDVAPGGYNADPQPGLPSSPLEPSHIRHVFGTHA